MNGARADRYVLYGDLGSRGAVALAAVLVAKGIPFDHVEASASLAWELASRSGSESGPYLRTPEGFVLADLDAILDWLERIHPDPALLPEAGIAPVRRVCARLLEDWISAWLPLWPRRSWATLEALAGHLDASGFLLGRHPTRPDLLLAAWLETEVLPHEHARTHLLRTAPHLVRFSEEVLEANLARSLDDAVPISLLPILERMATDYHRYLELNHAALKEDAESVRIDLGLGFQDWPVRRDCERRRVAIGREIETFGRAVRLDVRRVLEPVGAWHVLTLPAVIEEWEPNDPRSL